MTFRRDSQDRLSSVFSNGHANWADRGEDLACAAVSAILQAAWVGLTDHARVTVEGERADGRLTMRWPAAERGRADVQAIVAAAELAIGQIARQAPKHVRALKAKEP